MKKDTLIHNCSPVLQCLKTERVFPNHIQTFAVRTYDKECQEINDHIHCDKSYYFQKMIVSLAD